MKTFPMFLKTTARDIVILGGGEQAAQKARLALKSDAAIIIAAQGLDDELCHLCEEGRAQNWQEPITPALFDNAAIVFVATGCKGADAGLAAIAKQSKAVVNVVDAPDLCDGYTPSIVDRDPLTVAIGTEGAAPVLARQVKTKIETMLEPRLGDLVALAGRLRAKVAHNLPLEKRRSFWRWVFSDSPRIMHAAGRERETAKLIKTAIDQGGAPEDRGSGMVSLVGAGPGARDLITLRATQRLQEADVIFYDRLVDPDLLELARRDAERVYVGKSVGAHAWPQSRISALIVETAKMGKRVVRLKSGDPCIFGRATEEIESLKAAGIDYEIVPGVTAASAAAASLGRSLTERGKSDTLVLTTGMCEPGAPPPDWANRLQHGTCLALYMGVGKAEEIQHCLLDGGNDPLTSVEIVSRAATHDERTIHTDLGHFAEVCRLQPDLAPAIILIRRDREAAASIKPMLVNAA